MPLPREIEVCARAQRDEGFSIAPLLACCQCGSCFGCAALAFIAAFFVAGAQVQTHGRVGDAENLPQAQDVFLELLAGFEEAKMEIERY